LCELKGVLGGVGRLRGGNALLDDQGRARSGEPERPKFVGGFAVEVGCEVDSRGRESVRVKSTLRKILAARTTAYWT